MISTGGGQPGRWCQYDPAAVQQWLSSPSSLEPEHTLADDLGIYEFLDDNEHRAAVIAGLIDNTQRADLFGVPGHHIELWQATGSQQAVDGHLITIDTPDGRRFASTDLSVYDLVDPDQSDFDAAMSVLDNTAEVVNRVLALSYGPAATAGIPHFQARAETASLATPAEMGLARPASAGDWPELVQQRASQLVAAGEYPTRMQAFAAAYREVTDQLRQAVEDQVLAAAGRLHPADTSTQARLQRETAASIGDHRAEAATRHLWPRPEAAAGSAVSANPAQVAAASFATPAATAAGAGATGATTATSPSAGPVGLQAVEAAVATARTANSKSSRRSR